MVLGLLTSQSYLVNGLCLAIAALVPFLIMPIFSASKFKPKGKICYVTGGSAGLGKALAIHLVKAGAHVTIVARDLKKLHEVEMELQSLASDGQLVHSISADLTEAKSSEEAFDTAVKQYGGRVPDYVFNVAGSSRPKYFVDTTAEELEWSLKSTYWVQAYTAHAAIKAMVANRVKGHVVFVGSFLGYTSFVGYSQYSSGKYALRGLADALRNEMLLYDIGVTMFMPAGIDSPGYIEEQKEKPAPTKKLEESDEISPPEVVVGHLIRGLERGYYQPSSYFVTDLMRLQSRGGVPGNNPFIDTFWWLISGLAMPIWVMFMDYTVRGFKKQAEAELEAKGFYKAKRQEIKTV